MDVGHVMKQLMVICAFISLLSCMETRKVSLEKISMTSLNGDEVNIGEMTGNSIAVFIFMSPDCPLCINYTQTIMKLYDMFHGKAVLFLPVYSGREYEKEEILQFHNEYEFKLTGYLDPEYRLAKMVSATVTPEAVVVSKDGEIVYSGAIDDWMYETGKKRTVITHRYLENALHQIVNGMPANPSHTEPIGCYIEL